MLHCDAERCSRFLIFVLHSTFYDVYQIHLYLIFINQSVEYRCIRLTTATDQALKRIDFSNIFNVDEEKLAWESSFSFQ